MPDMVVLGVCVQEAVALAVVDPVPLSLPVREALAPKLRLAVALPLTVLLLLGAGDPVVEGLCVLLGVGVLLPVELAVRDPVPDPDSLAQPLLLLLAPAVRLDVGVPDTLLLREAVLLGL